MNAFKEIFSSADGRLSSMRLLVVLVILNEIAMRWVSLFYTSQSPMSTWGDVAAIAVPFLAKAAQSAFEKEGSEI